MTINANALVSMPIHVACGPNDLQPISCADEVAQPSGRRQKHRHRHVVPIPRLSTHVVDWGPLLAHSEAALA